MKDKFIWDYLNTEAIRSKDVKSILLHNTEKGGPLGWIVYAEDYEGELTNLCMVDSEEHAKQFADALIEGIE